MARGLTVLLCSLGAVISAVVIVAVKFWRRRRFLLVRDEDAEQ